MFYSHTFLARKGPLGTVWCAAHLQHKLKKSHYTATDIPSTVERIMFPEVPIALRMSGHLLLGVVRIYSKKVDYLYQDCNIVLIGIRKAFSSIEVNLPEDASHAPFHSITLPDTFELDALDLDADFYVEGALDMHLRAQEEITLTDQIPIGRDPYIAITFDEDVMTDLSNHEEIPDSGVRPMDEDVVHPTPVEGRADFQDPGLSDIMGQSNERLNEDNLPHDLPEIEVMRDAIHDLHSENLPVGGNAGFQDPGPSHQMEQLNEMFNEETVPQEVPEMEVMRDAVHDLQSERLPVWPEHGNDTTELDRSLDQMLNEKEILSPNMPDILYSGEQSLPFQQRSEPPASAVSPEAPEIFDSHISFGHVSPALAIGSTPPVEKPKAKSRKRKQLFDVSLVLPNKLMKKALEDSSGLLRKKKRLPCSALDIWKINIKSRKENVFFEPSVTGMCEDLHNTFREDVISLKPHLAITEQAFPEPSVAQSPAPMPDKAFPEPSVARSPAPMPEEAFPGPEVAPSPDAMPEEAIPEPGVQSPAPMPDLDIEIERLRDHEGNAGSNILPEIMPSPTRLIYSPTRFPSSSIRGDFTPISTGDKGSELDPMVGTDFGTRSLPTPDFSMSAGTFGSDLETPATFMEDQLGVENTGLSDIPELVNSAEELNFLEADDMTPTGGSPGTQDVSTLSIRTRAVAQYLQNHSPINPISEDPSMELSLNKILEGKTRKIAARMFFETLVLKNYGLVDVQQEEPYGDITLKMTPKLSKARF